MSSVEERRVARRGPGFRPFADDLGDTEVLGRSGTSGAGPQGGEQAAHDARLPVSPSARRVGPEGGRRSVVVGVEAWETSGAGEVGQDRVRLSCLGLGLRRRQ